MKIKTIVAAGLLAILGTSATAEAHDWRRDRDHHGRHDRRDWRGDHRDWRGSHRDWRGDRRDWRGNRDYWRGDRRWGYNDGRRWDRRGNRCWTEWRHHRQIRVCR
ncbi:hypothetical protein NS277_01400 [Novosphingobium barchaimii]|nr:hypothetical protein [Novosphingobium fluoreni]KTR85243.1 hypothetical protein NS277_01400 [Novosphingobium barchaimii]